MEDKTPQYLYHYTNIDKLALILKNRTIRLNPLSKMDDLQEQKTSDVKNIGRFVFVSSWTSDEEESIPMWKMYTDPFSGVRIKLKSNPFIRNQTIIKDLKSKYNFNIENIKSSSESIDTFLNLSELMSKKIYSPQAFSGNILIPVNYTKDILLLEPKILNKNDNQIEIQLSKIGKYKNIGWSFQNEWRYIMQFFSLPISQDINTMNNNIGQMIQNMSKGIEPAPIEYFDLNIELTAFENMEITVSPQLTIGNRVLLEALIEKYNPSAKLTKSRYYGLL